MTVSKYRQETDRVANQMASLREQLFIAHCECGSVWSVDPDGRPLSWLGQWATNWHRTLGHRWDIT